MILLSATSLFDGLTVTHLTLPWAVFSFSLSSWPLSTLPRDVVTALLLTSCSDGPGFDLCLHLVNVVLSLGSLWRVGSRMVKAEAQTI